MEHPALVDMTFHVMARGSGRGDVFLDQEDKSRFLERLAQAKARHGFEVLAYCLMENHVHLLLRGPGPEIVRFMGRVLGPYARGFNRRHERAGRVFQGRLRIKAVEDRWYLLDACRYIHMNPVRAGQVARPEDYPWSSFRVYLGWVRSALLHTDRVLSCFKGRGRLRRFYMFTTADRPEEGAGGKKRVVYGWAGRLLEAAASWLADAGGRLRPAAYRGSTMRSSGV